MITRPTEGGVTWEVPEGFGAKPWFGAYPNLHAREFLCRVAIRGSNNTFGSLLLAAAFTTLDPSRDALTGAVIGYGVLAMVLILATRGRLGYRPEFLDEPNRGPAAAGDLPAEREK